MWYPHRWTHLPFLSFLILIPLLFSFNLKQTQDLGQKVWSEVEVGVGKLLKRDGLSGKTIRLLPIGDSITEGFASTDGNGYRLALRRLITSSGVSVDFIGRRSLGSNNPDNQNEGYGGQRISQIQAYVKGDNILPQRPNVILIHAGTNDVNQDPAQEPYASAPDRLGTLIDFVLCQCPDAVVLVALLDQNGRGAQARVDTFNAAVPKVVADRYNKGYKVRVVDMTGIQGALMSDGLHPNDRGYQIMAEKWFNALKGLPSTWITAPQKPYGNIGAQTCATDGIFWNPANGGNYIAQGAHVPGDTGVDTTPSGNNDNISPFTPHWNPVGQLAAGIQQPGFGVKFADLDGDGNDDYLWVNNSNGAVSAWLNVGSGTGGWRPLNGGKPIAAGVPGGSVLTVFFADVDGDKREDYISVNNKGEMNVYLNGGPYGSSWSWKHYDNYWPTTYGATPANVYFGDMTGDGKAEVLLANTDGKIDCLQFISIGANGVPNWKRTQNIATTIGNPNIRLVDLNGDGRADFLSMDKSDGSLKGWLNLPKDGVPANDCNPNFVPIGGSTGVALGAGPSEQVRFGDINGDGKIDYLVVDPDVASFKAWLNVGYNNTHNDHITGIGAGVRFADLDGDGVDDYIAVGPDSQAIGFLNRGDTAAGRWFPINGGKLIAAGHGGAKRHQIHFADINGDGRADYLVVDDNTGAVICYFNGGASSTGGWTWYPQGQIAKGVGAGDRIRFADMNGDGRADYIYLDDIGAASVYLNLGSGESFNGWLPMNGGRPIASGVGADPADVQFADMNGDGLADYLWVHPEEGKTEVWYNGGLRGSGILWIPEGKIASGIGYPGKQVTFARIGTSGRADYIGIEESNGAIKCYFNACKQPTGSSGGGGGGTAPASGSCGSNPLPPPTSPDPGAPGSPIPPGAPKCTGNSCTPCTGTSCSGCTGSGCTGCKGSDCSSCSGPECSVCQGANCGGCTGADCAVCIGRDCTIDGGSQGGRLGCKGPSCTTCVGAACSPCSGSSCTSCTGADCTGRTFGCKGPFCQLCRGTDCDACDGDDCEACTGPDCTNTRTSCSGPKCDFCRGSDCDRCDDDDDCETCHGSDCGGSNGGSEQCHSDDCTVCRGSGCHGCRGPLCSLCFGLGCSGCSTSPCGRCFGADCPGCTGSGCNTCTGPSCSGCKGPSCTICSGPTCDKGGNCAGSNCPPDSPPPDDPSGCETTSTITNCAVKCSVTPKSTTLSTSCYETTCSAKVGCDLGRPTTTTSRTTVGCPAIPTPTTDNPNGPVATVPASPAGLPSEAEPTILTSPNRDGTVDFKFGGMLACSEADRLERYVPMTIDDARTAISNICQNGFWLRASNSTQIYVGNTSPSIVTSIGWATDQTGCQPLRDFRTTSNECRVPLESSFLRCPIVQKVGIEGVLGGKWIWSSDFGCVEYAIQSRRVH